MPQPSRTPLTPAKRAQLRRLPSRGLSAMGSSGTAFAFTPERYNLTPAQCVQANRLLRQAEQERPLRGDTQQVRFRHALRCAGIVSAVKRGVVGNRRFGRHLQGHHGGNTMRDHALDHLRSFAPIASLAARIARERREAETYYETHGVPLALGVQPTETMEQQRLRALNDAWETAQWQTQQTDRLRW